MGLSYGWEKFHIAMLSLTGSQPIRQRIIGAVSSSLIHLKDNDLPNDLVVEFRTFIANITSAKAIGDEGTIAATVNSLTDDQLEAVAEQIVHMHDVITRAYGK